MSQSSVVLVTGSSGYIGAALINRLAARHRLIGFDKIASRSPPPTAECVCIDLSSDKAVEAAFQRVRAAYGEHIASVIHLAAYYDLNGKPNRLYDEITVKGTERLLHNLQAFAVEQFIFTSTMLVHRGTAPGKRITEETPLDPELPYPESKIRTERLIHEKRGSIPVVIMRLAGVYDDMCHSAFLAHQIARIYERKANAHIYPGDLKTGQSALHLDDLADAVEAAIRHRSRLPPELTLLLGEPEAMSFDELQRTIGKLIHHEIWTTRQIPKALAHAGAWAEEEVLQEEPFIRPWMVESADHHYALDISRAHATLEWKPKHKLRKTLPRMVAALKADPQGWYRANKLDAARVAADYIVSQKEGKKQDDVARHEMIAQHMREMREMHFSMLWVHYLVILLGAWLAASPFYFGAFEHHLFSATVMHVTADRGLANPALRSVQLGWSDVVSGLLVMAFGVMSLTPRLSGAQWANAVIGVWLLFAPLIFWSPSAAVYTNDTLVGALVITFAILVPMMPGMSHEGMMDQSDLPVGWSYCPSTYLQRLPIIALGAFGFFIARYLAAYQMGHIGAIPEPFFHGANGFNGTEIIITSSVSKAWPIPDGGLGAVSYMFEVLMGVMGGRARWRTMPWMVAMFGIVVVPLGVISIYFIIIQPIVIGTYCSLCLLAALAMLLMIPLTLDELVAMGQFIGQSHRRGESLFRTFFMGGASPGSGRDSKPDFGSSWPGMTASALSGMTMPWMLIVSALLGIWMMLSRLIFGNVPPLANSDHLVGALVVTVAVIAMAEVGRGLRFINVFFGAWLIVAPWILEGRTTAAAIAGTIAGLALIALSLPRGRVSSEHYGSWDRFVV